jgi:hypothetical protein
MKFNVEQIVRLQKLLEENLGMECTDLEAEQIGKSIVRFVVVKQRRAQDLKTNHGDVYGKQQETGPQPGR